MDQIPKWLWRMIGWLIAIASGLATYDGVSNQFGWSKLPELAQRASSVLPIWAWLFLGTGMILVGLFRYSRAISREVEQLRRDLSELHRPPTSTEDSAARVETRKRRRELVHEARSFVAAFTQAPQGRNFRDTFESSTIFTQLRQHLSPEYMKAFNNRRHTIVSSGGPMDPFAKSLLDELDRLENEWGLYSKTPPALS